MIKLTNRTNEITGSLPAGEAHIGEIGGNSATVSVTPPITAGAYAAEDIVGGVQTLTDAARATGREVVLESITVTDLGKQNAELAIFFFDRDPTNGTYNDNAALDIDDTDMGYCLGVVTVETDDYADAADNSVASRRNIGLGLSPNAVNLYAIAKTTGTPTYTSTSDLTFKYFFLRYSLVFIV